MTPLMAPLVLLFPAFPKADPVLQLAEPTDGAIILAGPDATANISLRYSLSAPGASRLCLDLQRAPLRYYRGPILDRESTFSPYAKGCYAPGQPVTLQKLGLGAFLLSASAESSGGARLGSTSVHFAITPQPQGTLTRAEGSDGPPPSVFVPSYEWAAVGHDQSIPSGLEVRMQLHDHKANGADEEPPRYARIPPTWRLQVFAGKGIGFLRHDVHREATITAIEVGLRAALPMSHGELQHLHCPPQVELWLGSTERLEPSLTAERANLFSRRSALVAKLVRCTEAEEAAARATAEVHAGEAELRAAAQVRQRHDEQQRPTQTPPASSAASSSDHHAASTALDRSLPLALPLPIGRPAN